MQLKTYSKTIIQTWIEEVIYRIVCEKRAINNKELLQICGGTENILREEINPHFYHEIAETALNEVIKRKYLRELLTAKTPAKLFREIIEPLTEKLPTQTWRSDEQNKWQQFSTPLGIAYLIWKNLKKLQQTGLNIIRTTTDVVVRMVGVNIASDTINEIRRTFGIWRGAAGTAEEIVRAVSEENEIVELSGDTRIRQTRFQGVSVIEICPSSYEQIRELRETALVNIIQNSRNRFFLPENENLAPETLEKVLMLLSPASSAKKRRKRH
jgi:hypothetical protein